MDQKRKENLAFASKAVYYAPESASKSIGMPINTTELLGRALTNGEIDIMADIASKNSTKTLGGFKVLDREDMVNIFKMSIN